VKLNQKGEAKRKEAPTENAYELMRQQNIATNAAFMKSLLGNNTSMLDSLDATAKKQTRKKQQKNQPPVEKRKSQRIQDKAPVVYNCESDHVSSNDDDGEKESSSSQSSTDSSSDDDDADDEGEDGEDDNDADDEGEDDKGDLKIGATVFVVDRNWKKNWKLSTCKVDTIRDGSYMLTSKQWRKAWLYNSNEICRDKAKAEAKLERKQRMTSKTG
jgi:hypothetical protein